MSRKRRSGQSIKHESIKTQRLQLREARKDDLNDFHEFFSNSDVMQYWVSRTHTTIDQTDSYLNDMITSAVNGTLEFVIVLPASSRLDSSSTAAGKDKVIGTAGIWDETKGEIEVMLHRDHWGQGYMSEALTALVPMFWEKGFERLIADVDPRNKGSLKLLNRFGFVESGRAKNTAETDLGWCDSVYLELWTTRRF